MPIIRALLSVSDKTGLAEFAKELHATAQEIVFTSGGTEGNNWVLRNAVTTLKIERIISSRIEHHAVLHTIVALQSEYNIAVDFVDAIKWTTLHLGVDSADITTEHTKHD